MDRGGSGFLADQGSCVSHILDFFLIMDGARIAVEIADTDDVHARVHFHLLQAGEDAPSGQVLFEGLGFGFRSFLAQNNGVAAVVVLFQEGIQSLLLQLPDHILGTAFIREPADKHHMHGRAGCPGLDERGKSAGHQPLDHPVGVGFDRESTHLNEIPALRCRKPWSGCRRCAFGSLYVRCRGQRRSPGGRRCLGASGFRCKRGPAREDGGFRLAG